MAAYAAGINAFLQTDVLPMELKLLSITPAPWEPAHVLGVARVVAMKLNFGWQHQIARQLLVDA